MTADENGRPPARRTDYLRGPVRLRGKLIPDKTTDEGHFCPPR